MKTFQEWLKSENASKSLNEGRYDGSLVVKDMESKSSKLKDEVLNSLIKGNKVIITVKLTNNKAFKLDLFDLRAFGQFGIPGNIDDNWKFLAGLIAGDGQARSTFAGMFKEASKYWFDGKYTNILLAIESAIGWKAFEDNVMISGFAINNVKCGDM